MMLLWKLWCIALVMELFDMVNASGSNLCDTSRRHCLSRTGCNMALKNFFVGCNDVIYGKTNTCAVECKHALLSLLSTEDRAGISFIDCDCNGEEFCEVRKSRVEMCTSLVLGSMSSLEDEDAIVSCSLAQWICEADTSCLTALEYYARRCMKLVLGDKCTSRCNNSLAILNRQKHSRKLQRCKCDGTEEYDCQALKDNTERLCFHRIPVSISTPAVHNHNQHKTRSSSDSSRPTSVLFVLLSIFHFWTFRIS